MMASLEHYEGCATHREKKLLRAINSFLANTAKEKELIIVSDGCKKVLQMIEENYSNEDSIACILTPKQKGKFPGFLRGVGLLYSDGETVSYLDSDDYLAPDFIVNAQGSLLKSGLDMVYYDAYTVDVKREFMHLPEVRSSSILETLQIHRWTDLPVELKELKIGTPNICHLNLHWQPYYWHNWDGLQKPSEDWYFISKCLETLKAQKKPSPQKVEAPGYYLCHYSPGGIDV
jgi:glycosyltransferase involved in cell wall biosynthesis